MVDYFVVLYEYNVIIRINDVFGNDVLNLT